MKNSTEFIFDPSVIDEGSQSQHTSLEDLYGYDVFSDKFSKNTKESKKQIKTEHNKAFNEVMKNKKNNTIDQAFMKVMKAETGQVITNNYSNKTRKSDSLAFMATYVVLGMVLTIIVIELVGKIKKRLKKS